MQVAIVKRQPKRRCRIPRRPHPDLDYFFDRFERIACETSDDTGPEIVDLDKFQSPRPH
ncbi:MULTISPECIES: hypothetical protein [unclassified Bradyrhizobium]|uniref:hypothetical protein n=1 Tax=unclassified Bradyrhizobium TaxID=2631580 RepID=UPI000422CE5B|nr:MULTISPECIES: hypothetical protein [unclassified Bradyrhizobium]MCP3465271.1 hypothetical protein [Bradyrhizobium sp. CCGUVB23]